jgi:hypothetical protein
VISVIPMNRVHIDLRAGIYGHLNYSALLLLGALGPSVIGANVQCELPIALQFKVAHHFVKRLARGRAGRVEEAAAFGAPKTPKTLLFDPYQLPSHGAPRRRARRRATKLTCAKLGGLSHILHTRKTCLRLITHVGLDAVSIAQYRPRIRHSVDGSAGGVRPCPPRIPPTWKTKAFKLCNPASGRIPKGNRSATSYFYRPPIATTALFARAAGVLQKKKLIEYTRGAVKIVNRKKLEDSACECYGITQQYNGELGLK